MGPPSATGCSASPSTPSSPSTSPTRQPIGFSQIETPSASTDLSITKTDGQAVALAGTALTYTIVVANNGPLGVSGVTVTDALPASLLGASWTASIAGGATATQ